jgi:hypothetical protein
MEEQEIVSDIKKERLKGAVAICAIVLATIAGLYFWSPVDELPFYEPDIPLPPGLSALRPGWFNENGRLK